jgi:hypothetical protein
MRLITNHDFDGVVCAAMIADMENVHEVVFAHPKDLEDGLIEVFPGDMIANLPFHKNAELWFDHHSGSYEQSNNVRGRVGNAPSTAGLVYDFYKDRDGIEKFEKALKWVDKYDHAQLTYEEVLRPEGWILLAITLDPRTELDDSMMYSLEIVNVLRKGLEIKEIMALPFVKRRVMQYIRDEHLFKKEVMRCTMVEGNVSITDLRGLDRIPSGNRFLVFPLFARCNVNIRIYDHRDVTKVMVAVGKSIFDKSCKVNIGDLMAKFGGGGLDGAGSCPLPTNGADGIINDIIKRLKLSQ